MSKTFKLAALAALCAAATAASAGVTFDANFEGDTTSIDGATDSFNSGGRIEVNANAALLKQGDNFVNARASLLLGLNADSTVDDAWIQFGNSSLDFKFGRFEAVDLFPVAKDTVLVTPTLDNDGKTGVGYRANTLRGRFKDGHGRAGAGRGRSSACRSAGRCDGSARGRGAGGTCGRGRAATPRSAPAAAPRPASGTAPG